MPIKLQYEESTKALSRIRGKIFDYPPEKEEQAGRVLSYLKARKMRDRVIEVANKPFKHWMYACE